MDLYTKKIIELASTIPFSRRLKNPQVTVTRRTPICGSSITVDMNISAGKILEFGQKINACALGQASTSIVTKEIIGRDRAEIEKLLTSVKEMLTSNGPTPHAPFSDYEALSPAKNYKNRHASIMLILYTIIDAFETHEIN